MAQHWCQWTLDGTSCAFLLFSDYPVELSTQKTFNSEGMLELSVSICGLPATSPILPIQSSFSDSCPRRKLWKRNGMKQASILFSWVRKLSAQKHRYSLFHAISLSKFPSRTAPRMNFGWVDVEEAAGSTANTRLIPASLQNVNLFMALEHILSIVLRSCPGTALVPVNFGW